MITAPLLACAPNVAPATLEAVISVESGGNPFALNVNGLSVQPPPARDIREAAKVAASFIARGYSVDLGLMQVNSRNLVTLGLTLQQVLDPCTNIRGGATILHRRLRPGGANPRRGPVGTPGSTERIQHWRFLSGFRERLRGPLLRAG